jgi:hypothetical protein
MTASRERERYYARLRERRRARAVQPPSWCRRCLRSGHEKADCTALLLLWSDGDDLMIAESPERAARIFNDPLGPDSPEDLYSAPADWTRVEDPLLTLNGVALSPAEWVDLYGEGWLLVDGELAPRDP